MKQIDLSNAVPNQLSLSIKDACHGMNKLTNRVLPNDARCQSPLRLPACRRGREGQGGGFNIFLIQNKGKGPPGRMRSPALACSLIRADKRNPHPEPVKGLEPELVEGWSLNPSKAENEFITHINKSNFLSQLNF